MTQVQRLLGFIRPYSFRLFLAVCLMVVVGACEGVTALLIKPIFDHRPHAQRLDLRDCSVSNTLFPSRGLPPGYPSPLDPQCLDRRGDHHHRRSAGQRHFGIPGHLFHQLYRPLRGARPAQSSLFQDHRAIHLLLPQEPHRPPDVGDHQRHRTHSVCRFANRGGYAEAIVHLGGFVGGALLL